MIRFVRDKGYTGYEQSEFQSHLRDGASFPRFPRVQIGLGENYNLLPDELWESKKGRPLDT